VVAASAISNHDYKIKRCEDYGAGALVIRSLFEGSPARRPHEADFLEAAANISPEFHSSFTPQSILEAARAHDVGREGPRASPCHFASLSGGHGSWVITPSTCRNRDRWPGNQLYYVAADPT